MLISAKTAILSRIDDIASGPLVSVVIPTHNRPGYLREAIASAVSQSYRNLEILVRDNCSDSETETVVRSFADHRIHYVRHARNIGMTANVLGGFRAARGKYVTNLHDDDFWNPQFLEKSVAALEAHPEAALAFSDHYIVDVNSRRQMAETDANSLRFGRSSLPPGLHRPFKNLALSDLTIPVVVATLFRREAIDWDDFPDFNSAYDFWLMYLACRDGQACYYIPERLTSYRVHDASESAWGRVRLNIAFIEIYQRMLEDPGVAELHQLFRNRLKLHHNEAAVALLREGNRRDARDLLLRGMLHGFSVKAPITYAATYIPTAISRRLPGRYRFAGAVRPAEGVA